MAAICFKCCSLPCEALGHCCSGMEKCCSKGCSSICGLKCCPKNRPSPIFLSYTLLFNVPISVIALVTAIQAFGDDCGGDPWIKPPTYNLVMTGLSAFFIAFAIRVYMVLSASYDDGAISGMEAGTSQQPQSVSKTFRQRVWYTACHDPFTFVYMFVFPFSLVWSIAGLAGLGEEDFEGCTDTEGGTWGVSTAMLVYLLCTCFVAMISCCWEVKRLRKARYEGQTDQPNIPPAQLATHMFVPNFSGKAGYPGQPPYAQQAPQGQFMNTPDAVPVGTAVQPPMAAQAPQQQAAKPGIIDQMQQAFRR